MEKNSFDKKIFVFMVVVFMVVIQMSTVYAINKDSEGYSLSKGQKFIKGFRFTSTIAKTFFIPTATTAEWSSFLANLPLGISRCTPKAGTWTTKVFGNDCTAAEPACGKTTYGKESWSRTCVGAECGGDCIGATSGHRDCEDVGAACPCDPLCPLASTVCLGCVYTGDNYCNDGADCNVVGTKTGCIGGCGSNTCTQNCKDASTMCTDESDTSDDECGGTCNVKGIKAIVDGYWSGWTTPNMIGTDPNGCRNINPNSCDGKCNEEIDGHKYQTRTYTPAKCEGSDAKSGWMSTQPIDCKITCNPTCDYDCIPDCKAANTICVGYKDTSDDGCDNGVDCNVIGTKKPVTCPAANTIDCGEVESKKSNGCGGGCSVTGTKAVDGGLSDWFHPDENVCIATCDGKTCNEETTGTTLWEKSCTNPTPSCGGDSCSTSPTDWRDCTKTCTATCDYDCVPDCKVANTICVGYSDTSDDGCDNDADCNVIGTKSPVTCPAANTIDCGEVKSKKSNGCGGGCSVTGTKAVDGVWSGWVRANNLCYAYCNPSSCGKKISGSTYWTHTCTDPAPSCGGETCSGSSTGWKYNDCTKTCPACPPDDPPACVASCGITEKKCCDGKSCEFSLYPDYSYSCK